MKPAILTVSCLLSLMVLLAVKQAEGGKQSLKVINELQADNSSRNEYSSEYTLLKAGNSAEISDSASFAQRTFCYPNPARDLVSHIQVFVVRTAAMEIMLYNNAELPVLSLKKQLLPNTIYTFDWDLADVANGEYIGVVRVTYDNGDVEKKMLKIAVLK